MTCLVTSCSSKFHVICLANEFLRLTPGMLVPMEGKCPVCRTDIMWADLVRFKKGFYRDCVLEAQVNFGERNATKKGYLVILLATFSGVWATHLRRFACLVSLFLFVGLFRDAFIENPKIHVLFFGQFAVVLVLVFVAIWCFPSTTSTSHSTLTVQRD